MTSTFTSKPQLARRLALGPTRTPAERRSAIVGAALGGVAASIIGLAILGLGIVTSSDWQASPPPVALFVLLPIPAGVLAGLRLTVELTRPKRLSLARLLGVSCVVVVLTVGLTTSLIGLGYEMANGWPAPLTDLLSILVVAVAYSFFIGVFLLPIVVPTVAIFATVVRRIGPAT